jgi:hypothetical protein
MGCTVPCKRGRAWLSHQPPGPHTFHTLTCHLLPCCGILAAAPAAATVRVRPAFAGEGRYFVRVPEGTNRGNFELFGEPEPVSEEEMCE